MQELKGETCSWSDHKKQAVGYDFIVVEGLGAGGRDVGDFNKVERNK